MSHTHDHWDTNWEKDIKPDIHTELLDLIEKYAQGKRVLEVGFGTGGDLMMLAKKGFKCTGIEKSEVAYEYAKKKYAKSFKAVYGDAEKLPWGKNSFDVIFHQGVIEHFRNTDAFMIEQVRVLSRGGILVIDVPHLWNLFTVYKNILGIMDTWYGGWERSYSARDLRNLAKKHKLKTVEIYYRGIWPHRWGKFLFPEKIIRRQWAGSIISRPPISWVQKLSRKIYNRSKLIQILSSYNIILIAQKS